MEKKKMAEGKRARGKVAVFIIMALFLVSAAWAAYGSENNVPAPAAAAAAAADGGSAAAGDGGSCQAGYKLVDGKCVKVEKAEAEEVTEEEEVGEEIAEEAAPAEEEAVPGEEEAAELAKEEPTDFGKILASLGLVWTVVIVVGAGLVVAVYLYRKRKYG